MLLLNFAHPLTDEQIMQVTRLAHQPIQEVRTIVVRVNQEEPLEPQVSAIVDTIALTPEQWQTLPLLINPPGYAPAAFVLLAELHGRIGHFPALVRMRPRPGVVTVYEVVELIDLQTIREHGRLRR